MHDDTLADTADGALRLIEMTGCENLRLNYQPSARVSGEDPLERLRKVRKYVVHCHAQNFRRLGDDQGQEPIRSPLRDGLVDYCKVVNLLRDANYTGWIAIEFAHTEGDGKYRAVAEDLQFLLELLS
jgi:sugar phosphate isomerase/epimerase